MVVANWELYGMRTGFRPETVSGSGIATSAASYVSRGLSIASLREDIFNLLPDSPSFKEVCVYEHANSEPLEKNVGIINSDDPSIKFVRVLPGDCLLAGSLIDFSGAKWLLTSTDIDDEVYQRATIERCNYILKFNNALGNLVERNCIVRDVTKYLIGEQAKEMVTVGSSRMSVTVAKDDETSSIKRGTRFLIDDPEAVETIAFEVTKPDRVTGVLNGHGVYKYLVVETAFMDTDDRTEMIPDDGKYVPEFPESIQNDGNDKGWF